MKYLKKYALLLLALSFIVLGAVMPYLASKIQDGQIAWLQKSLQLSMVNLTLRKEGDAGPTLRLLSGEHSESQWNGEMALTDAEAKQAAITTMEMLNDHDMLESGVLTYLKKSTVSVHKYLAIAKDGQSALIWVFTWSEPWWNSVTIDDATGKAVRITVRDIPADIATNALTYRMNKWQSFLQDYYDYILIKTEKVSEYVESWRPSMVILWLSSKDGETEYELKMEIGNVYSAFNISE